MKATRSAYVAHLGLAEGKGVQTRAPVAKARGTAKRTVTLGRVLRWTFGGVALVVALGPLLT